MTQQPGPARFQPGDNLVDALIEFWHTQDHGKPLDEAAADWLNRHLSTPTITASADTDRCDHLDCAHNAGLPGFHYPTVPAAPVAAPVAALDEDDVAWHETPDDATYPTPPTLPSRQGGCGETTFVGIEPIEDEDGEATTATMVQASCSGNIANDCGWRKRLTAHDRSPADWWLTSDEMNVLHSEHMTHTPAAPTANSDS